MNKIAESLIYENSKSWLADKIGISRVTLDTRLSKGNWKKSEIQMLLTISKKVSV